MNTHEDFLNRCKEYFFPLWIESVIPHSVLRFGARIVFLFMMLLLIPAFGLIAGFQKEATLGFFILSIVYFCFLFLDAVVYSYMWKEDSLPYEYECAELVWHAKKGDPLETLLRSSIGKEITIRAGIDLQDVTMFLKHRHLISHTLEITAKEKELPIQSFLYSLIESYPDFKAFLATHGISKELFWKSALMAIEIRRSRMQKERWWSLESLSNIHPIGKEWAYGIAYYVLRFCEELRYDLSINIELHPEETRDMSLALSSQRGSNVLIVGDTGGGKMEIVEAYARECRRNNDPQSFLVLRTELFLSRVEDAITFEKTLSLIFLQIEKAGNITFVIPDMSALIRRGNDYGVSFVSIINPFMRSSHLRIIAIADTEDFHTSIEPHEELVRLFSVIRVKEPSMDSVFSYVYGEFQGIEKEESVTLTFGALYQSVELASIHMPTIPLYFASVDLLYEAIASAKKQKRTVVYVSDVLSALSQKTGVSHGTLPDKEKKILEELEDLLRTRIVGQEEAIVSIANAIRRSRAELSNPNKPIGSFLFLGPTGVGKTETAKALAEVFFGAEKNMLRLDMSEYSGVDGVEKLLGSKNVPGSGVLAHMIRDNPYGVLLLDEFEKTHESVHDIFLQILDEGIFRDAFGRKINARNIIFIATSNAGTDFIRDAIKKQIPFDRIQGEAVETIIKEGIFKAELLNRFDGIVLFHPLSETELKEIAKLLLGRLQFRLKEKNITLHINDAIIHFLVEKGSNPHFGARALSRAIQDTIQNSIAKGIIEGVYTPGSQISFTEKELASGIFDKK